MRVSSAVRNRLAHSDRKGAVWAVLTVGFVSIGTGIVAILTDPAMAPPDTLETAQSVAEFSGVIVGFGLLVSAWALYRNYRLGYVSAIILLVVAAAHGTVQWRLLSVPLVVISIGGFVLLVLTSRSFTRRTTITPTQLGSLAALVGVLCYGTVGTYTLQNEFAGVESAFDALYFTLVTATTVGYGDIYATTEGARLFTFSLVALGPSTLAVIAGSLIGPALEGRLSRTGKRFVDTQPDGRLVILGASPAIDPILEALERGTGARTGAETGTKKETNTVVVTDNDEQATRLTERERGIKVIRGEPTDQETLKRAGLEDAHTGIVDCETPLEQIDAVLAGRATSSDCRLIALGTSSRAPALEGAGADVVLDPDALLAQAVVDLVGR